MTLFRLKEGKTMIGSDVDADVLLRGPSIVRHHCAVDIEDGCATLIPLNSGFCHLNGDLISKPSKLTHGKHAVLFS
jgi:hypothetical protein